MSVNRLLLSVVILGVVTVLLIQNPLLTDEIRAASSTDLLDLPVSNLTFQADIFGDSRPETIQYVSDLAFHSWGGYGTNSLIVLLMTK